MRDLYPAGEIGKWHLQRPGAYGSAAVRESSILSFTARQRRPPDAVIRIAGDARQDAAVTAALNAAQRQNPDYVAPAPDSNKAPASTCATFCAAGLRAIGIAVTQTSTVRVVGSGLGELARASGVVTPVGVYNSILAAKDPRVSVLKPLPQNQTSPDIKIDH